MINNQRLPLIRKFLWVIPVVIAGIVYATTLAPSVMTIDSGELAAVLSTGGIAHPTGYPLFTILGWLWTKLPGSDVFMLNVLAMLFCLTAVFAFVRGADFFVGKFRKRKAVSKNEQQKSSQQIDVNQIIINLGSIICGALFLVFNQTFWEQSTSIEVYSLHACLSAFMIWFLLRAFFSKKTELKPWLFVAGILALQFANHLSTIMILPLVASLFFFKHGLNVESAKKIGKMLVVFFPILTIFYSYLFIVAGSDPVFNWGDPDNWEKFIRHVSGWQFQVWVFESSDGFREGFTGFAKGFLPQFGWVGGIFAILGGWYLMNKTWKIGLSFLITFLFCVFWGSAYNIKDIGPYFLLAYLIAALFIVFGVRYIIDQMLPEKFSKFGVIGAILITIIPAVLHYAENDKSGIYVFEDYAVKSLEDLPENALLIGTRWDYHHSASWYYQQVENVRPDVALIDFELLRRSWYIPQLDQMWPDLFKGHEAQKENFLYNLEPFEREEAFNPALLTASFDSINTRLFYRNSMDRPIFFAPEFAIVDFPNKRKLGEPVPPAPPTGYRAVPMRYFFRIIKDEAYIPLEGEEPEIRWPEKDDRYSKQIRDWVTFMRLERALYEKQFGKTAEAKALVDLAIRDHPEYQPLVVTHQGFNQPGFIN